MISALIALLIQLGAIATAADYDNLSAEEQQEYMEMHQESIIIEDVGQI